VTVIRADGTEYPHAGTLDFSDFSVNASTGSVAFRGIVPNPERSLLPGMYVMVRLKAGVLNKGFEVPQLAVQRDSQGSFVLAVARDGTVEVRRVEVVGAVGANWAITEGLADGDQVIVSGMQRAAPGMKVNPQPVDAPGAAPTPAAAQNSTGS
jgi:membrane fusion protein (multidrug efflux system)